MSEVNDGVDLVEDQIEESPALETDYQEDDYSEEYDSESNDDSQETDEVEDEDKANLRRKVEEQQRIIDLFQQTMQQPRQEQEYVPQEPEYDPDDLATYESVQKIIQREVGSVKQSQRDYIIQQQKQQMISSKPDYQQMYEIGVQIVQNSSDPKAMEQAIMASANPPELIYNLGLSQATSQKPRQNVAGKVKKNLSRPNTLSQAGGQRHDTKKDWSSAPRDEVENEIRKRMLGL